jgi:SAM-dependent methyltransferase
MNIRSERSKTFVDFAIQEIAKQQIVLDVGGGVRFGKWLRDYEHLFSACDYRTFDYDESTHADVIGDIHALPLEDESVDGIICSSVLEHVANPLLAMEELRRILRPGGKLFLYVPSIYPYHAHRGHYPDYWRFFEDTLRLMCEGLSDVRIQKRGSYFLALSFFFPLQHRLRWFLTPVAEFLDRTLGMDKRTSAAGFYVYAIK